MSFLLFAILSSSLMTLVLRLFRSDEGNRYGVIVGNYLTCIVISLFMLPRRGLVWEAHPTTLLLGILGGFFFVAGLVTIQSSILQSGATLTAAFSKLGLLVSLFLSVFWFGEKPNARQLAGIVLVLLSILLINLGDREEGRGPKNEREKRDKKSPAPRLPGRALPLLLLTLLTCGAGDAMAKVVAQVGIPGEDSLYFFFLFVTAFLLSLLLALLEYRRTGKRIRAGELAPGILVGIPNYFSSYLLLRSLMSLPAFLVYPVFSTGTILLVMAVSFVFFRERPGRHQLLGLLLILAALVLLS